MTSGTRLSQSTVPAWDKQCRHAIVTDYVVWDSYEDPPLVSGGKTIRITFDGKLEDFRCARVVLEYHEVGVRACVRACVLRVYV